MPTRGGDDVDVVVDVVAVAVGLSIERRRLDLGVVKLGPRDPLRSASSSGKVLIFAGLFTYNVHSLQLTNVAAEAEINALLSFMYTHTHTHSVVFRLL